MAGSFGFVSGSPMLPKTESSARWCWPLLAMEFAVLLGLIMLYVGYRSASGDLDAAGQRLGFNEPLTLDHLRLMAGSLTLDGFLTEEGGFLALLVAGLVGLVGRVARASKGAGKDREFPCWKLLHSVIFLAVWAGVLLQAGLGGARWTGETIVEGELCAVLWFLLWLAIWPLIYGCRWLASRLISAPASARGW